VLPEQPAALYAAGKQMTVPLLVGSNANEGTPYPVVKTAAAFAEDAHKQYGNDAEKLLALYPAKDDAEAATASYDLMRERTFGAPVRAWAIAQAKVAPVYYYFWAHVPPFPAGLSYSQQSPATKLGAYHGAEMAYAFGLLDSLNWNGRARDWTAADRRLSAETESYWVNFAKTGNPNGDHLPQWPAYDPQHERLMVFGDTPHAGDLPNKPQLDFFLNR
jgi:para-nitrobenzyl esterase